MTQHAFKNSIVTISKKVLPVAARNMLMRFAATIAYDEFRKLAHSFAYAPSMHLGLQEIAKRGFQPKTILDIGAFEGKWTALVAEIWPQAHFIMVEPNIAKKDLLENQVRGVDAEIHFCLLGAEDGKTVPFAFMEAGSSVLEERSDVPRKIVELPLTRLDTLLDCRSDIDLMKVDAQGYELEILKGASNALKGTKAVILEVALIEINRGAPLMHEVIRFMHEIGFISYEVLEFHRRPLDRALNQIDIFFVREDSPLIQDKRHHASS